MKLLVRRYLRSNVLGSMIALTAATGLLTESAAGQDPLRVFFIGRSDYGHAGGIPAPFEENCAVAGAPCRGHRHWDFVEPRLPRAEAPESRGRRCSYVSTHDAT
jgi:hypothetical protein